MVRSAQGSTSCDMYVEQTVLMCLRPRNILGMLANIGRPTPVQVAGSGICVLWRGNGGVPRLHPLCAAGAQARDVRMDYVVCILLWLDGKLKLGPLPTLAGMLCEMTLSVVCRFAFDTVTLTAVRDPTFRKPFTVAANVVSFLLRIHQ